MRSTYIFVVIMMIWFLKISQPCPVEQRQCTFIMSGDFTSCEEHHRTPIPNPTTTCCKNKTICERRFKISYINIMPYYKMSHLLDTMFNFCCGDCAKLLTFRTFNDTSKVSTKALASSDFVYPFLGKTSSRILYGFHFVAMLEAPQAYYITMKIHSPSKVLLQLVASCMELWPLIVMTILLSVVSGFVAWSAETWGNKREFPRPFFTGICEGFWWAFVSMTTVGYGDKAPRSVTARIFAVLWILMGITICSIFTASLTAAVTSSIVPETPIMAGKKVACLRNRLYEAALIAEKRGDLVAVESDDYLSGIKTLFKKLSDREVDGIVLDTYAYHDFRLHISNLTINDLVSQSLYELVFNRVVLTVVSSEGESLSYGMLIRAQQDSCYFRKYISDNMVYLKTCNKLKLNDVNEKNIPDHVGIFSVEAGLFWPTFTTIMIIIGFILLFGFLFEVARRSTAVKLFFSY